MCFRIFYTAVFLVGLLAGFCCQKNAKQAGIEFIKIPAGTYQMGDTFGDGDSDEQPVITVKVDAFLMSRTEVTVGQFRQFVEATGYKTDVEKEGYGWGWTGTSIDRIEGATWRNPGFPQTDTHPVVNVSWNDAVAFCDWAGCRLPNEDEWEYAARDGGKKIKYAWGNDAPHENRGGNVADESGQKLLHCKSWFKDYDDGFVFTAPVASFAPDSLGLYDMTGNVWEWCMSQYEEFLGPRPPQGKEFNNYPMEISRVLRGGSWADDASFCRCSDRSGQDAAFSYIFIGFRVAK